VSTVSTQAAAGDALPRPLREPNGAPIVSTRSLRALRAIAEALFSTDAGPPPAERLDWLLLDIEDFLARAGPRTRLVFGLAVLAVSVLAPLGVMRFVPLRRLSLKDRVHALRRLENSRVAAPLFAVKALLSIIYYEHPEAARAIGFDGACLGQPP
jgi:hypothetical protein